MKFKKALQNKLRFPFNGLISTEDLFDLNLKQLDAVYKKPHKKEKRNV